MGGTLALTLGMRNQGHMLERPLKVRELLPNHDFNAVTPRITNGKIGIARTSPRTSLFTGLSSHDVGYGKLPYNTPDIENQNDHPLALNLSQEGGLPYEKTFKTPFIFCKDPIGKSVMLFCICSDTAMHQVSSVEIQWLFLRYFYFIDFKNCYKTLPSVNTIRDWRDKQFILNTSVPFFSFTIPSDDRNKSMITDHSSRGYRSNQKQYRLCKLCS